MSSKRRKKSIIQRFLKPVKKKAKPITRKQKYEAYLLTPAWKAKARTCILSAGNRCEACFGTRRLQAHHFSYERLGCETPIDLFCLCDNCHKLYHRVYPSKLMPLNFPEIRSSRIAHLQITIKFSRENYS